ncbi:CDP-archaeol synthase [Psychroserpens sp. NJDZ02]|uniref:CDP-archaeol synthase n=1 Tax=Psychroserpens sp. NJDZ02 TaxID=2570561 RepID=UPI0010A7E040|nr:CDP-archaeol synthase [Psychroserpens sp. NJDZ02]QCE40645.1 CDP-archaeol synthase [Psychroserpens sp. NJDZ02]
MSSFLEHITVVLAPLIVSNILHMLVVKRAYFEWLKQPILDNAFGSNKTWRGFVFVPLVNAVGLQILDVVSSYNVQNAFVLGFMLGFAYMLFELPNSYMKRKLGIKSGQHSSKNQVWFALIDKTDSAFGVSLFYFLLGYIDYKYGILLFLVSSLTHISASFLLLKLKLKQSF